MAEPSQLVRTIPLGGGSQDNVPEFLQDSPSLSYTQNARFRKMDEIEKTQPHSPLSTDGLEPGASDPVAFSQQGDSLVAIADSGMYWKYPNPIDAAVDDWVENEGRLIPAKNERILTSYKSAGRHATFARAGDYIVTAIDTYTPQTTNDVPTTSLTVEARSDDGTLLDCFTREDAVCPVALTHFDGNLVSVYYVDTANDNIRRVQLNVLAGTLTDSSMAITVTPHDLPWAGPAGADFPVNPFNYNPSDDARLRSAWRTGFCQDGGQTGFLRGSFNQDGSVGCLCYLTSASDIEAIELDLSGDATGSTWNMFNGGANTGSLPLDVAVGANAGDNRFFFLFNNVSGADPGGVESLLRVRVCDEAHSTLGTVDLFSAFEGLFPNGTILHDGADDWKAAATRSPGDPYQMRPAIGDTRTGVMWWTGDETTSDHKGTVRDVRLASIAANDFAGGVAGLTVVLQQWANYDVLRIGNNVPVASIMNPLWNKNVTSVLTKLSTTGVQDDYFIISTYDAAQSKAIGGASTEQSVFLANLEVTADLDYYYLNRVALEPEDTHIVNTYASNGVEADENKRKCVLSPGEIDARMYVTRFGELLHSREYGDAVYFDSSCPSLYDGQLFGEAFVLDQPEIINLKADNLVYENLQYEITYGKNFQWKTFQVVTGFVDATGAIHRSAPSALVYVEGFDSGDATDPDNIGITVNYTQPMTAYRDRNYFVEVYTAIGTADPQLAGTSNIEWDTATGFPFVNVVYAGGESLEVVRDTEAVYTAGGVLPADTWPDFSDFAISGRRMFALSAGTPGTIYYSKLFDPNIAPEFSASLVLELGRNRRLSALGVLDEKVIVFEPDAISVISNSGPDNTGNNGDFFLDNLQTTVGCEDPESVIETPDGLMFFSTQTQTFHLISRDLQIVEIGEGIEDLCNGFNITGAVHYVGEREVRFYGIAVPGGEFGPDPSVAAGVPPRPPRPRYKNAAPQANVAIVYNYQYQRWTVLDLDEAPLLATRYMDTPSYLTSLWNVYMVDDDWSNSQLLKYRTPWIKMASLQSYGLTEKLAFVGKYLSDWNANSGDFEAGDIKVTLAFDYSGDNAYTEEYLFRANVDLNQGQERLQFSVNPHRRKAEAIQVTVEEVPTTKVDDAEPTYGPGRGFALAGLDIIYTPKRGLGVKTAPSGRQK